MIAGLVALVPLAALGGWWTSSHRRTQQQAKKQKFPRNYLLGLNYLLNEQPDKAVELFIKMLEVDSDTVETHLALGSLFRRRGEVDRAIRIHQNLIARPQLDRVQRAEALLALGQDYMSAGVLDRAEHLLLEVVELRGRQTDASLALLLEIYQREKSWDNAIAIAAQMKQPDIARSVAHFYCEKAEIAYQSRQTETALAHCQKALAKDPNCVRATIMQGNIHADSGKLKQALTFYQRVLEQDEEFFSEVVPAIVKCYQALGKGNELHHYLQTICERQPSTAVVMALAEYLNHEQGAKAASEFLQQSLAHHTTLKGLKHLIDYQMASAAANEKNNLLMLEGLVEQLIESKPIYRCTRCGFSGKKLHWQCPGCHQWSTIKPIAGPEGD